MKTSNQHSDGSGFSQVSIPTPIFEKIKARLGGTEFKSVSEYVSFVLAEVLDNLADEKTEKAFSKEEEEEMRERFKILGYLQ